ncbi:hypothetical protein BOTU111921_24225 [Bordetella tumbae]|uniref:ankyrin repeat domain-containing protein n=1 Tax=Bordetella tumbae TaxID=1649139 RepID=UPI0039EE9F4E
MELMHSVSSRIASAIYSNEPRFPPGTKIPKDEVFHAVRRGDVDGLSYLLDQCQVDLTAIDDDGETALHLAISIGRDGIAKLLLEKCGDAPLILNALDREGYTPLMRASAMAKVDLMQALVKKGGETNISAKVLWESFGMPMLHPDIAAPQILIEAEGELSKAFVIALIRCNILAAELYFYAGASTSFALEQLVNRHDVGPLQLLLVHQWASKSEVVTALGNALQSANTRAAKVLIPAAAVDVLDLWVTCARHGELEKVKTLLSAVKGFQCRAVRALLEMKNLAEAEKVAALRVLIRGGAMLTATGVIERAVFRGDSDADVRSLINAGASTIDLLMKLGRHGDRGTAQRLIGYGANPFAAMDKLIQDGEQDAANVLAVAAAWQLWGRNQPREHPHSSPS